MCGITGIINFKKDVKVYRDTLKKMTYTLKRRGPDEEGEYLSDNVLFGHRRLAVVDKAGGKQPMIKIIEGKKYVIVYNGELYNTEELRKELIEEGFHFQSYSDTEVLLSAYIAYKEECVKKLIGIFSFAVFDESEKKVFLARDQMGVKPLFYTVIDGSLIFGSEIKTIFAYSKVKHEIDINGINEIFALGPAVIPGSGVYKNIKELAPANCMEIDCNNNINGWEYWTVKSEEFNESEEEAIIHTRQLLVDAIKRQLVSDVPICTLLSGGLDSSAISAIAAIEFQKTGRVLKTFSIDYEDNYKYFKSSLFQPTSDEIYAEKMSKYIKSSHEKVIISQKELADSLREAVIARDLPGMADIDSSMLLLFKRICKDYIVCLSGECADEIFGGYPWFTREEMFYLDTFPWSRFVSSRKKIINKNIKGNHIDELVKSQYEKSLKKVPHNENESKIDYRMKEISYLNLKWFMVNLLVRKDRVSMYNSLEVRVPFADIRLVDYAFNMPAKIKLYNGQEKGLLREALKGILPEEIIYRKKSPYPKTHNPVYTEIVCNMMNDILNKKSSPILEIIDKNEVQKIVDSKGESYKVPWYGQLMSGPQLIAYLISMNIWLMEYNVDIIL